MSDPIRILWEGGSGEYEDRKSRFLADVRPVQSEEEALAFIESIKKKYWDARHHCYAYVIGDRGELMRCSDDGEPAQTAGRPMLDVLAGSGVRNLCVVVTRYFGGTLLGTGGLVRAYSTACARGLENSVIIEKCPGREFQILTDYSSIGRILYLLERRSLKPHESSYTDRVELKLMVPEGLTEELIRELTEATSGQAQITPSDLVWYSLIDGEVLIY